MHLPVLNFFRNLLLSMLLAGMISCDSALTEEEFAAWVNNEGNGLYWHEQVGDCPVRLGYIPAEFQVIRHFNGKIANDGALQEVLQRYRANRYLNLKITDVNAFKQWFVDQGVSNMEMDRYLGFDIQKDLFLSIGSIDIPCALSHLESGMLDGSATLSMTFPHFEMPEVHANLYFTIKHNNETALSIPMPVSNLNNIPAIKWSYYDTP